MNIGLLTTSRFGGLLSIRYHAIHVRFPPWPFCFVLIRVLFFSLECSPPRFSFLVSDFSCYGFEWMLDNLRED